MKRNDWLLFIAVCFYSFLFYRQSAGINFIIFNLVLLVCLILKDTSVTKNGKWLAIATGSLATSFCVGYYGNMLSVTANIISLTILSALSIDRESSIIVGLISSGYSYFSATAYMILTIIERKNRLGKEHSGYRKQFILIGIPIIITFLFFFLYRASNPLFDKLADKINFDFISINWIACTLIGTILLYGFFFPPKIESLSIWDKRPLMLEEKEYGELRVFNRKFNVADENRSGIILFALLNILLLVVNLGDINYLLITHKLPDGLTDSEFVHQGINTLIVSIVIAIAIVLFYFRGGLNFFAKSRAIKTFVCLWVFQNAFMIYSTSCRNTLYISECGLTYKRIGVYIYLLLALIGLTTTLVKIIKARSNNFLFRTNGWIFYVLLIVLSFPDWARIVTQYNIRNNKMEDLGYVFNLSDSNISDLLPLYRAAKDKRLENDGGRNDSLHLFSKKLYSYLAGRDTLDWKSWYYNDSRVYNDITNPDFVNAITVIDLSGSSLQNGLAPLNIFSNLTNLNIINTGIKNLSGIEKLKNLETLNLGGLHKLNYVVLSQSPNLRTLSANNDSIIDIQEIGNLPNLRELDISDNNLVSLNGIDNLKNLEVLNLSGNRIRDYAPLYRLQNLKRIYVKKYGTQDSVVTMLTKNFPTTKIIEQ